MSFTETMDHVAQAFEALGALVLAAGTLSSFLLAGLAWHRAGRPRQAYPLLRQALGGTLLLGLEILVAADLVRTIAVEPTVSNVLILGLIVLIRTFLSFSLETEINGTLPWRRATASGADMFHQALTRMPTSKPDDQPETNRAGLGPPPPSLRGTPRTPRTRAPSGPSRSAANGFPKKGKLRNISNGCLVAAAGHPRRRARRPKEGRLVVVTAHVVIAGAGLGGLRAAEQLRAAGHGARSRSSALSRISPSQPAVR